MNTIIDSGTQRTKETEYAAVYSIGGEEESGFMWIQPSISHLPLGFANIIVDDVYIGTKPLDLCTFIGGALMTEFSSWELASDDTLARFEDRLE